MARPVVIRDETILEAARQVFLERGIQATTAEVAERAGVSEGSIFKRWKSKVDLFRSAMGATHDPAWLTRSLDAPHTDLRAHLIATGLEGIEFFRRLMPLMMMSWSNAGANGLPGVFSGPETPPPVRAVAELSAFFSKQIEAGNLRPIDANVLARVYLGAIKDFVFFELLHKGFGLPETSPEQYVHDFVELLWSGCGPIPTTNHHATNGKALRAK
jgi:AcrR family transcriptional regulator